jgi:hypothetical protein
LSSPVSTAATIKVAIEREGLTRTSALGVVRLERLHVFVAGQKKHTSPWLAPEQAKLAETVLREKFSTLTVPSEPST